MHKPLAAGGGEGGEERDMGKAIDAGLFAVAAERMNANRTRARARDVHHDV